MCTLVMNFQQTARSRVIAENDCRAERTHTCKSYELMDLMRAPPSSLNVEVLTSSVMTNSS